MACVNHVPVDRIDNEVDRILSSFPVRVENGEDILVCFDPHVSQYYFGTLSRHDTHWYFYLSGRRTRTPVASYIQRKLRNPLTRTDDGAFYKIVKRKRACCSKK